MRTKMDPAYIESLVADVEYHQTPGTTLTVCVLTLTNGSAVVGTSNVINPANYDAQIGKTTAYQNAFGKIWELEGYAIKRDMRQLTRMAAQIAHEVNRAWCESLGDMSQPAWEDAPDWQKDSAITGMTVNMLNGTGSPEESHKSWFDHKRKDGWHWGPVKDPEVKEHPCMVPYDQLPPEQRHKDKLFTTIAKAVFG